MECACYTFGDAALHLTPCLVHARWAKAIKAMTIHDEREACAEMEASAKNGFVAAVVKIDGKYVVRLFYIDGRTEDGSPPFSTAEAAARAMATALQSMSFSH